VPDATDSTSSPNEAKSPELKAEAPFGEKTSVDAQNPSAAHPRALEPVEKSGDERVAGPIEAWTPNIEPDAARAGMLEACSTFV
jgi:hypothetical protein